MSLPRSALLALWLKAALDGTAGPDEFARAVLADDPQHLILGWPGLTAPITLGDLPAAVRRFQGSRIALALPTPGDPLGLAGPADFNIAAVEAGHAAILVGPQTIGLLPALDARTVVWSVTTAEAPQVLDPYEEDRQLRQVLLHTTSELARLDVASWQPAIPDLLMNLQHREPLPLPGGLQAKAVEAIERAHLCLEIVELAREGEGGAVTNYEITARRQWLTDLHGAARRALVAVCSASLITS